MIACSLPLATRILQEHMTPVERAREASPRRAQIYVREGYIDPVAQTTAQDDQVATTGIKMSRELKNYLD